MSLGMKDQAKIMLIKPVLMKLITNRRIKPLKIYIKLKGLEKINGRWVGASGRARIQNRITSFLGPSYERQVLVNEAPALQAHEQQPEFVPRHQGILFQGAGWYPYNQALLNVTQGLVELSRSGGNRLPALGKVVAGLMRRWKD